ncbi:MAG: hypothetical protein ABL925_14215, partial [Methylococcales bacterium]
MFLLRTIVIAASIVSISGCCSYFTDPQSDPYVYRDPDSKQSKDDMKKYGEILKQRGVSQVIFVYGTFVGNDPFGFVDSLSKLPNLDTQISNKLKEINQQTADWQTKDEGNYTNAYVKKFCEAIGNDICNENDRLKWGSGNYHKARLDGSIHLAQQLANRINDKKIGQDKTILLLGHSHAGQLFALLTTFLEGKDTAQALYEFMDKCKELSQKKLQLLKDIETIKTVNLDFVTFGTPVRYSWGKYSKFHLLSVINHRSNSQIEGIFTIKDGDYVQQWGGEGTDVPAPDLNDENELSKILDDKGMETNLEILDDKYKTIEPRETPRHRGDSKEHKNISIDYKDNLQCADPIYSKQKLFGHAVYTNE